MNTEQARDALTGLMKTGWAARTADGTPVIYDNISEIDITDLRKGFVRFVIEFVGSRQSNVAIRPNTRIYGSVECHVFVRDNTGTKIILNLVDELTELFGYVTLGGVHLQTPSPSAPTRRDGWYSIALRIPFYFDSNT